MGKRTLYDHLVSLVAIDTNDCVEWQNCRTPLGYGRVCYQGKHRYTHRLALEIVGQYPTPESNVARHLCNNPPCVNPRHLRWGTAQDNINDRSERGVWREAMRARAVQLSDSERQQMIYYSTVGMPQKAIGQRFGVSDATVRRIIRGYR